MYHVLYEKRTTNTHSASESIRDLVTLVRKPICDIVFCTMSF